MKNKTYEIDAAMVFNKFYCCKCGCLLKKYSKTRLIKKGDPDYKEHRTVGRMIVIGDIEFTDYDFICPICERITKPDDQYIIEIIQKKLNKRELTEKEYNDNILSAKCKLNKRRNITDKIVKVVFIILAVICLYFCIFYR